MAWDPAKRQQPSALAEGGPKLHELAGLLNGVLRDAVRASHIVFGLLGQHELQRMAVLMEDRAHVPAVTSSVHDHVSYEPSVGLCDGL